MRVTPSFYVGQIIYHRRLNYRGVVIDVDPCFKGSELWYQSVARTRPDRDQPWYRILVDGTEEATYAAESDIEPDRLCGPVSHPEVERAFTGYEGDRYRIPTH